MKVSLRKFPYPYRCALSICSDIDNTRSIEEMLKVQKYICLNGPTELGDGLGLETGNSFWFYSDAADRSLSYFQDHSGRPSKDAPAIRELIRSGYIDVLHTYGDFNRGGFARQYAEACASEMARENLKVLTWINHGNSNNAQNIGPLDFFYGDDPAKGQHYHMDLLRQLGFKYFWISQVTHLVGQDSRFTFNNYFKNSIQRLLSVRYRGKQIDPFFSNHLMQEVELRDSSRIRAFMRFINPWGRHSYCDINNLPNQISHEVLKELISSEGYMVLYTHLGSNAGSDELMPKDARRALIGLSELHSSGDIFVTTTTRLLRYCELMNSIQYTSTASDDGSIRIDVTSSEEVRPEGLCFYSEKPEATGLFLNGKQLRTRINPPDHTRRPSVSVPFEALEFPL